MRFHLSILLLKLVTIIATATSSSQQCSSWNQKGSAITGSRGNRAGESVAMSSNGTVVAVGGPYAENNSGYVGVFSFNEKSNDWDQLGENIYGEARSDKSGEAIAMSSDGYTIAIGATKNNGKGPDSGHVRVYKFNSTSWIQFGNEIDGAVIGDFSGNSVSMSSNGDVIAIGAHGHDNNKGHVRVYTIDGDNWIQLGNDVDGEATNDKSGTSVVISSDGNVIAVGASHNDNEKGEDSGHVRVYSRVTVNDEPLSSWKQLGNIINGEASDDQSGTSLAISSDGSVLAVASKMNGYGSGHVRVYKLNTEKTTWIQQGEDIDGESFGDELGSSVAISSDGKFVAIGANKGKENGYARVYHFNDGTWTQRGDDIQGEASGEKLGSSIDISSDGNLIAVSDPYFTDENGPKSGHVLVMEWIPCSQSEPTTSEPTRVSSSFPTNAPSSFPTSAAPTSAPSSLPTNIPSPNKSDSPSSSRQPSTIPSYTPTTSRPTTISPTSQSLSLLKNNWKLLPATDSFTFSRHNFTAHYEISENLSKSDIGDTIQAIIKSKDCVEDDVSSVKGYSLNSYIPRVGTLHVAVELDYNNIDSNEFIFTKPDDNGDGEIAFCIHTSLFSGSEEVISRELNIAVDVDVKNNFEISSFDVATVDQSNESGGIVEFGVTAAITSTGSGPDSKFQPGDIVTVTVHTDDRSMLIESIESFIFSRQDTNCSQSTKDILDKELTVFGNCNNNAWCSFSSILKACFYDSNGNVTGSGVSSLKFKGNEGRRLVAGTPVVDSGFSVNFAVIGSHYSSSASSMIACKEVALVLLGYMLWS